MIVRLTAEFWVYAYLNRLRLVEIPAFVVAKGDLTAGVVVIKLNTLNGQAVAYQRSFDIKSGGRKWIDFASGAEAEVDMAVAKQRSFDPDLWVIEVEDRRGRHLLEESGLAD